MRKEPKPEQFTAIIDSREKRPLDLSPLKMLQGTLYTGDYSILGLENHIAIERKSLEDFIACCGRERERFDKACQRLLAYPVRAIVIETSMAQLELGAWRSQMTPKQICASFASFAARGLNIIPAGSPQSAATLVSRMLFFAARERYRQCYPFLEQQMR